jgi:hypothetical protein
MNRLTPCFHKWSPWKFLWTNLGDHFHTSALLGKWRCCVRCGKLETETYDHVAADEDRPMDPAILKRLRPEWYAGR